MSIFRPNAQHRGAGAAILSFGLLLSSNTQADATMRCGVHLVSVGAIQEEVLSKCGRPYSASGTYWLYRQGQMVYRVIFKPDGEVRRIKAEIRF
jgi:hypothetical protein